MPAPSKRAASHAIVSLALDDGHPGRAELIFRQGGVTTPKHNIGRIGGSLVYNDSEVGLAILDSAASAIEATIPVPGDPPFARGLALLADEQCLVGSQRPASLHRVDVRQRRVVGSIELGGHPFETVYAVARIPDGFSTDSFDGFGEWADALTVSA